MSVVDAYFAEELRIALGSSTVLHFIATSCHQLQDATPGSRVEEDATPDHMYCRRGSGDSEARTRIAHIESVSHSGAGPNIVPTICLKLRPSPEGSPCLGPMVPRQVSPQRVRRPMTSSDFRPVNTGHSAHFEADSSAQTQHEAQLIRRVLEAGGNAGLIYTDAAHCVSESCGAILV